MRMTRFALAVPAAVLVLATAVPASAAPGATPASITITGGVLSIAVSTDPVSLGTRSSADGGGTVNGSLGQVTVTDKRGGAAGWTASVVATPFTSPAGSTLTKATVSYTPGPVTTVGTVTASAHYPTDLATGAVAVVVSGAHVDGINTATWNPTITVDVPGGVAPSVYTATFTHSVA